jgi:CheY-like chemotaxis protein
VRWLVSEANGPSLIVLPKPNGSLNSLLYISRGTKSRHRRDVFWAAGRGSVPLENQPVILVIEDDQAVQTVVELALTEGGFEPAIAASGEEAVTLLKGGLTTYRALVTDINLLGQIDGWEIARVVRTIDPSFPIVYMSGKDAEDWASKGVPNSIMLAKPFAPAQLATLPTNTPFSGFPS